MQIQSKIKVSNTISTKKYQAPPNSVFNTPAIGFSRHPAQNARGDQVEEIKLKRQSAISGTESEDAIGIFNENFFSKLCFSNSQWGEILV